jgi:hypothetical protein
MSSPKNTIYKLFKEFLNISFPFSFGLSQANENETVGALGWRQASVTASYGSYP